MILRGGFGIIAVIKSALTKDKFQKRRWKGDLNCQFRGSAEKSS